MQSACHYIDVDIAFQDSESSKSNHCPPGGRAESCNLRSGPGLAEDHTMLVKEPAYGHHRHSYAEECRLLAGDHRRESLCDFGERPVDELVLKRPLQSLR
jgi:hypothetical protein